MAGLDPAISIEPKRRAKARRFLFVEAMRLPNWATRRRPACEIEARYDSETPSVEIAAG
jgi:hypothetical protein